MACTVIQYLEVQNHPTAFVLYNDFTKIKTLIIKTSCSVPKVHIVSEPKEESGKPNEQTNKGGAVRQVFSVCYRTFL